MENVIEAWVWIPIAIGASVLLANLTIFGKKLKDKKIGIIGMPGSGKTTLAEFLANDRIPKEYSQTLFTKDCGERTIGDLGMKIVITDTKSNRTKHEYEQELEILRVSDIIIYLFDMSKLFVENEKDSCLRRITKEIKTYTRKMKNLQEERDSQKILPDVARNFLEGFTFGLSKKVMKVVEDNPPSQPKEKIFIALGTFEDKVVDMIDNSVMSKDEFNRQFANIRETLIDLFKGFSSSNCFWEIYFFNSLVDEDRAEKTVKNIFETLKEIYG